MQVCRREQRSSRSLRRRSAQWQQWRRPGACVTARSLAPTEASKAAKNTLRESLEREYGPAGSATSSFLQINKCGLKPQRGRCEHCTSCAKPIQVRLPGTQGNGGGGGGGGAGKDGGWGPFRWGRRKKDGPEAVTLTLVSFAVSRKAYSRVRGSLCEYWSPCVLSSNVVARDTPQPHWADAVSHCVQLRCVKWATAPQPSFECERLRLSRRGCSGAGADHEAVHQGVQAADGHRCRLPPVVRRVGDAGAIQPPTPPRLLPPASADRVLSGHAVPWQPIVDR